ncbi:MAG: amino acid permease, partial [Oceanicoccus sp.]
VLITFFVVAISAVAIWGIKQSAWVVTIITVLEVCGLVYVVYIASDGLDGLTVTNFSLVKSMDSSVATGILLGSFLAFYAYIGFEDMVNIAEEIKNPEKVLPAAIVLALVIATLLYMLVAYAALSVLSPEQLSASNAPLADVVISKGYSGSWISFVSLVAVINGAIIQIIMASRVVYGMASRQLLPSWLSSVNSVTLTPIPATLLSAFVVLILALAFPLSTLAQLTSLIVLSVFVLVNIALIRLNHGVTFTAGKDAERGKRTIHFPRWIPFMAAFLCIFMLLVKMVFWLSL